MYGMLYGMVWPYFQHESMVWYGPITPLLQDHLGQVQGQVQRQRQTGVGQEQEQPKILISGQSCKDKSCLG